MPEGHTIHRLAAEHKRHLAGRRLAASSPQGRFAADAARLDGHRLLAVEPYGKHLFYTFDSGPDAILHVHLGLYGRFTAGPVPAPEPVGALRLRLTTRKSYVDLRGPTACELLTSPGRDALLNRLGPDPLRRDADPERAWRRVAASRAPLGTLLLDQTVLAGVGNAYRAEALFRLGVHPGRAGRDLGRAGWESLWTDLVDLLRLGVSQGRIDTLRPADRRSADGARYYVYRRAGEPCLVCGCPIRAEPLAARAMYWCPGCQPN